MRRTISLALTAVLSCAVTFGVRSLALAQVPNDTCSTPEPIGIGSNISFTHHFAETTETPGCPQHDDRWYSFTAPASGVLWALGSPGRIIAVYDGLSLVPGVCPEQSDLLVCDSPLAVFPITLGKHYLVQVGKANPWDSETTSFELDWFDPPTNEECTSPQTVAFPTTVEVPSFGSEHEDPAFPSCPMVKDLWFRVVIPQAGYVRVLAPPGPGGGHRPIAVYIDSGNGPGGCPLDADLVACGAQPCEFLAMAATTYMIRLGNTGGLSTDLQLYYFLPSGPDDERYRLRILDQTVAPGTVLQARVLLDSVDLPGSSAEPIAGWSFGVCHEESDLDLLAVVLGDVTLTVNGGGPVSVANLFLHPGSGYRVGVVVDSLGSNWLPPGLDYELAVGTYRSLGEPDSFTTIFTCALGTPAQPVALLVGGGALRFPATEYGIIGTSLSFRRGDCNDDGLLDIADAVTLLTYLFPGSPTGNPPSCLASCDANVDGAVDIGDALRVLAAIFGSPAIPLPGAAGCSTPDFAYGGLVCVEHSSCP